MSTRNDVSRDSLLQGTLDLLVLRILALGAHHGHGIAIAIQTRSGHTLLVDHGSLYPALQRLEQRGWIGCDPGARELLERMVSTNTHVGAVREEITAEAPLTAIVR